MSLNIALDVEGVLTDTHSVTYDRSEKLGTEHGEDWNFPTDEHYEEFMGVSQSLWRDETHLIPPQEGENLRESVQALHDAGHTVDIVTHRHNVDKQVRNWLEAYGVDYHGFRTPPEEKNHLDGYHVHIDDKPTLAEAVAEQQDRVIALVAQPWNQHVESNTHVERVSGLSEAADLLTDEWVIKNVKRLTEAREEDEGT